MTATATLSRMSRRAARLAAGISAEVRGRQHGSDSHAQRGLPPFHEWLALTSPRMSWHWPHLAYIRSHLDRLTAGEIDRLMIFCPPQHGKSQQASVRYPVWRLARDPSSRVVLGAYNQTFASKLSRQARKVARACGDLAISRERSAAIQWETEHGGGYRACGVGSPPTGEGADLLIIDDPFRSRKDAESATYRDRVWDWYSEDLLTRLGPSGQIVLINTRWHEDDLSGRILDSEDVARWAVVSLPALAEKEGDPLGRAPGEALCPERKSREELIRIQKVQGPYGFSALYQQRPQAREGGLFKRGWFVRFADTIPAGCGLVRFWDKAGTAGGGCYSCGVLMAKRAPSASAAAGDPAFYVVDVRRRQLDAHEREAWILQTAEEDRQKYGKVTVGIEQEGGSSGKQSAQETVRNLAGFVAFAEAASGSKEERAYPFASQCGGGNVALIRGAWNRDYIEELCSFPTGKFADQVDASSGAFNRLNQSMPKGSWRMERI